MLNPRLGSVLHLFLEAAARHRRPAEGGCRDLRGVLLRVGPDWGQRRRRGALG
jgi:hypothetical protein